jgi:glucokinase
VTTVWERLRDPAEPRLVLGVDVGGTKTAALLVDHDDAVRARTTAPTRPGALTEAIIAIGHAAMGAAGVRADEVGAIGIGLPGQVDPVAGTVGLAVNLVSLGQPIARQVEDALGIPTFIEHDARAAARWLSELDAATHRALGYVSIGTGIAAGVVLDGRLVTGAQGMAGEIGHVVAEPNGPECVCGLRGCLEAVASGPAIAREARAAAATGGTTLSPTATTADVFRAASEGDPSGRRIVESVAAHLARGIRGLVLSFGLDLVIVGGGVARAGDALMEPLLAAVARERGASSVVRALLADGVVRRRPADPEAGTWGAVTVARAGLRDRSNPVDPGGEEVERRDATSHTR